MSLLQHMVFFPVLIPLLMGTVLLLPFFHKYIRRQRVAVIIANLLLLVVAVKLLADSLQTGTTMYMMGDWQAPFGIALVNDPLASVMLVLSSVLGLAAHLYACAGDDKRGMFFHPLFMFQMMGINGAFLTGDVFNLFVFFEILLMASYALIIHGGGKQRTQSAVHYVLLNLAGSSFFLIGLGIIYAAFGTLNLADMAHKAAQLDEDNIQLAKSGAMLLLIVFGLKAALLPLHFWLPRTYSYTATPVAALFAIMTKVGIYSIWRVHTAVFGNHAGDLANITPEWLWPLAWLTLVMAVVAVLASQSLKMMASNLIAVSAGTLLLAIAVNTEQATAAAIYYLIHSTLASAALLLIAGLITDQRGQAQDRLVKARAVSQPAMLGILFFIAALALIGMPPLSGFVGKVMLLQATTADAGWVWPPLLISGLVALVMLSRAGSTVFWRTSGGNSSNTAEKVRAHPLQVIAVLVLLLALPLMVIFGGALTEITQRAAEILYMAPQPLAEAL